MSKIKLVAMDLDNTLLDSEKQISKHTEEVLKEAIRRGVYIVPATGRIFKAIPEFLRDIPGVRYAVCCNGATVYDQKENKIIYTNHLPKETVFSLFDILEKYHCTRDIYQNGQGYMERCYFDHLAEYGVSDHVLKLVRDTRLPLDDLRKYIASVSSSLGNNIEINQIGCDKGDGLLHLAEQIGLSMDEVMACGDAGNDTMMIKAVGTGVVMENGQPDLKEIADFVTKTNNEDGVAYAIEKLVFEA